jgi:hypothetical protein|tara:strand:- start:387 stop:587 length:201 start_codon:yes stop_codon:yes gene_type:complete
MLRENKKGGWIGIGAGVGTALAVATEEPAWIAAGIAMGSVVILVFGYLYPNTSSEINEAVEKFEEK